MRISDLSSDVFSADLLIATRQLELAVVELVEARERDELEFVSHRAQLALELGDVVAIEIGFPIEARRTIVGEQPVREFLADRLGEATGIGHAIGRASCRDRVRQYV